MPEFFSNIPVQENKLQRGQQLLTQVQACIYVELEQILATKGK